MVGAGQIQRLRSAQVWQTGGCPDCTQDLDLMAPLGLLAPGRQPEYARGLESVVQPETWQCLGPQDGLLLPDQSSRSALAARHGPHLVRIASVTTPL